MNNDEGKYIKDSTFELESKRMDLDAGVLGKFFGGRDNAPINIACVMLILLIAAGILSSFSSTNSTDQSVWKFITPIITLILGYLFGQKSS